MTAPSTAPDVRQLQKQTLAKGEFPGERKQAFRVYIDPATHAEIWTHSTADTNVEICGVLVGQWAQDEQGPFLNVSASIRGEAATKKFAEVTFTHDTWAAINAQMDTKYTDRSIVGWYHTHPDFGIFLSERDRFIQENFFSGPGQVALVVDPIRKIEGIFVWQQGKTEPTPHYWVGNRLILSAASENSRDHAENSGALHSAVGVAPAPQPTGRTPDWLALLQKLMQYVLVFLVGWLLAGRINEMLLDQARQQGVALAVYQFGLRPGLELRLSELQSDILGIGNVSQQILRDHQQQLKGKDLSPEEAEKQLAAWKEMELRLSRSMALVGRMEQEYCINDEQREHLKRIMETEASRSQSPDSKHKDHVSPPKDKEEVRSKSDASPNATPQAKPSVEEVNPSDNQTIAKEPVADSPKVESSSKGTP